MISKCYALAAALCVATLGGSSAYSAENVLFGYTHLLPSPFTVPAGTLILGTSAGIGITNFLEVSTNLVADIYQIVNVSAKVSLLDFDAFALALTGGYQTYNLHDMDVNAPDFRINSWLPGAVAGFGLGSQLAAFVGGNLNFSSTTLASNGVTTSGYFHGASVETDLSWAYNPDKKSIGNVLSAGVSYDFTYQLAGFGVSHYWRGFHIGVHYYPNATQNKFLPIIGGGATVNF